MSFKPKRLLRDLTGRSNRDMSDLLHKQILASIDGAWVAREAAGGQLATEIARKKIAEIEHEGDKARGMLVMALRSALVTPFDREDMFRVSRSIDDVLDDLQDFVRELDLFQTPREGFIPVIDSIIEALELLQLAIEGTADGSREVHSRALVANKSCNDIRRKYQIELAELLDDPVTADMLRSRELLRRLDVIGLTLVDAVDALADAAIKRIL